MAPSKRIAKDRPGEKQTAEPVSHLGVRSRVRATQYKRAGTPHRRHKRANTPHRRQPYNSVSIPQLVYELLTIDKYNQDAKCFPSSERFRTPRRRIQKYNNQKRFSYKAADNPDSSESVQVPNYTVESTPTSVESLTEPVNAANSSAPSSPNSSVSNISIEPIRLANSLNSARALFRKKSLLQLINNYIKAGIQEGKRQAKKYIRKALSFGVRSGYLIPADRQGSVLRVCPTLDTQSWSSRRTDIESRQRRRGARRGEIHLKTIDDRKAMRRGIVRDKPRRDVDNGQPTLKKREEERRRELPYKRQPIPSSASSLTTMESSSRKSPDESTVREKNKPKIVRKRKKLNDTINNKQQRRRGNSENIKKAVKRRGTALSSKRAENDYEPVEEICNDVNDRDCDQYENNGDNCRATTERWKSMSNREGSRMEEPNAGMRIDNDHDRIECKNDDEGEKSEEASVEHDASGMITEMDA